MTDPPFGMPPGPPTPPTGGPPLPGSPTEPPARERSRIPVWAIGAGALVVLLGGLGVGLYLGTGGDDDGSDDAAAATTTTTTEPEFEFEGEPAPAPSPDDPFSGDLSDFDDLLPEDLLENLPEGFEDLLPDDFLDDLSDLSDGFPLPGDVQAIVLFRADATPAQEDAIRDAFEDSSLLSYVMLLTAEDLADLMPDGEFIPGFLPDTLSAFGDDPEAVRELVCSFADAPGVMQIQIIGADPCDQST